ncbi:MAG TPA: sulfurtransferase [Eubacteriaceae bacterium]|nr:sulfurtransferase [Eubacteriaceae bacterium]
MKRSLLILLLALAMVLTFAACGGSDEPADDAAADENGTEDVADNGEAEEPEENVLEDAVNDYFANLPEDNHMIGEEEFVEKVKAGEDMVILDIRGAESYEEAHVQGAVNLPWGTTAIADAVETIPTDKPVYLYCVTGQTAGQAVATLQTAGIDVKSVRYGMLRGIQTVEGHEAILTDEPAEMPEGQTIEVAEEIKTALQEFYANLATTENANNKINSEDAAPLIEAGDENYAVLSVRQEADYAENHIEGAINIPWGAGMQENFDQLPKDKTIITYCYSGQTAGQTVGGLRLLGYDAISLDSGMGTPATGDAGWMNGGFPTVSE